MKVKVIKDFIIPTSLGEIEEITRIAREGEVMEVKKEQWWIEKALNLQLICIINNKKQQEKKK